MKNPLEEFLRARKAATPATPATIKGNCGLQPATSLRPPATFLDENALDADVVAKGRSVVAAANPQKSSKVAEVAEVAGRSAENFEPAPIRYDQPAEAWQPGGDLDRWLAEERDYFIRNGVRPDRAEHRAYDALIWQWSEDHPPDQDGRRCLACGDRLSEDARQAQDGAQVCNVDCEVAYGTGRRQEARDALSDLGVFPPFGWCL